MKTGIIGATILISATTIDDTVWLVPYTTSSHLPTNVKIIHGITFILTLELLSILCVGIYSLVEHGLFLYYHQQEGKDKGGEKEEEAVVIEKISFVMQLIGISICWFIAIFLYVKKMLKRRRRKRDQEQTQKLQEQDCNGDDDDDVKEHHRQFFIDPEQSHHTNNNVSLGEDFAVHSLAMSTVASTRSTNNGSGTITLTYDSNNSNTNTSTYEYSSFDNNDLLTTIHSTEESYNNNNNIVQDDDGDNDINTIPTTPSIPLIMSFTTLGALDEISYFPALIMGKIFTPIELCLGAFFAAILILSVVTFFLARCKPVVDFLDSIPLYGIVGLFAIVLTLDLLF